MIKPWRMKRLDQIWAVTVALNRYPRFDACAALSWANEMLDSDKVGMWRTEDVFLVAGLDERFYAPDEKSASIVFLCSARSDHRSAGQILALARTAKAWALERGCRRLDFSAETLGVDFGPIARRLGRAHQQIGYMIELGA